MKLAITGATGWLGQRLAAKALNLGLSPKAGNLRLLASKKTILNIDSHVYPVESLKDAPPLSDEGWIVAHFAGLGQEMVTTLGEDHFIKKSHELVDEMLNWLNESPKADLINASSGAVYKITEKESANPYAHSKKHQEDLLLAYSDRRGMNIITPRIFNLGGAGINKKDIYALSSLILQAKGGGDLQIQAKGPVWRSYVDVDELLELLLCLIKQPFPRRDPFDTVGLENVEIQDLAERVLKKIGSPQQKILRTWDHSIPADTYLGRGNFYRASLNNLGIPQIGIDTIIAKTAKFLLSQA